MSFFGGTDLAALVQAVGYLGLFLIIFAESGVFLGIFLPGDSLLFTAGFLASQGYGNISVIALISFVAAVVGDSFGYAFGKKVGPKVFRREDGLFFKKDYVERIRKFYARHGARALVLARFVPFLRTLAPIFAGVGGMPYRAFFSFNVVGGLLWACGIVGLGYLLGSVVPGVDKYLLPLVAGIVVVSLAPSVVELIAIRFRRRRGARSG